MVDDLAKKTNHLACGNLEVPVANKKVVSKFSRINRLQLIQRRLNQFGSFAVSYLEVNRMIENESAKEDSRPLSASSSYYGVRI